MERIAAFLDHPSSRVKSTAVNCLWNVNPHAGIAVVKRLAESKKVWERDAAKYALASCPLPEGKELLEKLEVKTVSKKASQESPTVKAEESKDSTLDKILFFPVHVGLEKPIPLGYFVILVLGIVIFFLFVAMPFMEWLLPVPGTN